MTSKFPSWSASFSRIGSNSTYLLHNKLAHVVSKTPNHNIQRFFYHFWRKVVRVVQILQKGLLNTQVNYFWKTNNAVWPADKDRKISKAFTKHLPARFFCRNELICIRRDFKIGISSPKPLMPEMLIEDIFLKPTFWKSLINFLEENTNW